jgi:hypothetical protein
VRQEKEFDYDRIKRIHDRVDYHADPDNMENKKKSNRFDLKNTSYHIADDALSTELSDEGDLDIYRKYKLALYEEHLTVEKLEEQELALKTAVSNHYNRKWKKGGEYYKN